MTLDQVIEVLDKEKQKLFEQLLAEEGIIQAKIKTLDTVKRRLTNQLKEEAKKWEER